jgi:hypothetical protein
VVVARRLVLETLAGQAAFGLGGVWATRACAGIPHFELRFFSGKLSWIKSPRSAVMRCGTRTSDR